MSEDFLHFLWQNKFFTQQLTTVNNDLITVLNPGFHNHNSGPDFSNARIMIGETLWAGNVEIHINSSDWFKHGHQNDEAYTNVVLHVVYKHDAVGKFSGMPVCELQGKIDANLYSAYSEFLYKQKFVPCIDYLYKIPATDMTLWLERMLIEKLQHKADFIQNALIASNNDWEEALYHVLARSFGFNINSLPFEMLSRSISYKILARHSDNRFQIEALLFGQAGMLSQDLIDPYGQSLLKEYAFLRKKYHLAPINSSLWKYMRLRPVNFPSIRIAQFASLIAANVGLLSKIVSLNTIDEMMEMLQVSASPYWDNHFVFDHSTSGKTKNLGKEAARLLIINSILPFIFVYGSSIGNDSLCNKSLAMFEKLPGEKNALIDKWRAAGLNTDNAYNTQALMGLKTSYCDKKKCLNCRIGNIMIKDPEFVHLCNEIE